MEEFKRELALEHRRKYSLDEIFFYTWSSRKKISSGPINRCAPTVVVVYS